MRTGYIRPNQDRLTPIAGRINIVLASVFLILAASCTTGSDPETLSLGTATGDGTTSIETAAPGPVSTLNPEMLPSFDTPGGTRHLH